MAKQFSLVFAASLLALAAAVNAAQASRQEKGWISLFDGKTMDHWNDPRKLTPPGDAWSVEDGALKANPHPRITEDLVSTEAYANFELEWDWKISPGGNAGVKYRVQEFPIILPVPPSQQPPPFEARVEAALGDRAFSRSLLEKTGRGQIYVVGFEYQMIDNSRHPDAKRGPLYQTGALYSIAPPSQDGTKSVGEWNHSRLIVDGRHIEHWINGSKVVEVEATPTMLQHALLKRWGEGSKVLRLLSEQPVLQCPITLQNHGDPAWFRNLRIRSLP